MRTTLMAGAALLALGSVISAQTAADEGTAITLELLDGSTVTGTLVDAGLADLVVKTASLGEVTVPRLQVKPPPPPAPPEEELPLSPWSGSFDAGIAGTGGNTDTELFRASLNMFKKTDDTQDTYEVTYQLARTDGTKQQDRLFTKARREWKLDDSPWRPFVQGTWELDKFKDWTYRVAAHTGAARTLIDEAEEELTVRLGLGASKEAGAEDDGVKTEALLGASYRKELTDTSRFTASVDVYPSLIDQGEYRGEAGAWYEAMLSDDEDASPWTFKSGVTTNYDSTPGDFRKNDYAYFAGLGVIF